MIKVLSIIGARPQIIKAAAFSRAVQMAFRDKIKECILQTGQHYDENIKNRRTYPAIGRYILFKRANCL